MSRSSNKKLSEAEADAAFAEMASDEAYLDEAVRLAQEFETSDWEAFNADSGPSKE